MNLEDLRGEWKGLESGRHLPDAALLEHIQNRARERATVIRRRDRRELIVAAVVCVFFAVPLITGPWVSRIGALVFIAGSALMAYRLHRARIAYPRAPYELPLVEVLDIERAGLVEQIRLLQTVAWWYGAPLGVGVVLIFAGVAGTSWLTLAYVIIVAAMVVGIIVLNRRAVQSDLLPALEELDGLREQLQNET